MIKNDAPRKSNKKRYLIALVVLLACGVGAYSHFRPDPNLAKAEALRQKLTAESAKDLPWEERREVMREYWGTVEKLSPENRSDQMRKLRQRETDRLNQFFAASAEEQAKLLDEEINKQEKRRKEGRGQWGRGGGGDPPGGGQPRGGGGQPGAGGEKQPGDPAAGASAANPQQPGTQRRASTPEERDRRRREFLDSSTADDRAKLTEYRHMMNDRRKELGLPPAPSFGRGGGGGRPPGNTGAPVVQPR